MAVGMDASALPPAAVLAVPPNAACGKRLQSSDFIKINDAFYTTPFTVNSLYTPKEFCFVKKPSVPLLCMFVA